MIIVEIVKTAVIKDKDMKSRIKDTFKSIEEVLNKLKERNKLELA